jgi:cell division protein FtsW
MGPRSIDATAPAGDGAAASSARRFDASLGLGSRLGFLGAGARAADPRAPAGALLGVVLALMALGLLVQASHASTIQTIDGYHHELTVQLMFRLCGVAALMAGWFLGPAGVRRALPALVLASFAALVLCWVPGIAAPRNGSHRWIDVGIAFQPSEMARLVLVLWVADRCARLGDSVRDLRRGVLPTFGAILAFFAAVLLETDLGGALLMLLCALSVLWVGGARLVQMAGILVGAGGGALLMAGAFVPYVRARLMMFFGQQHNDQVADTLQALSSGGLLGRGLGHGVARNSGVPYLQSDYVFAQIGEELGLVGMLVLLGLALAFLWHGQQLVRALAGRFEALAAFGLLISVGLQGMLHVQVVARLAPPKGITLPFVSDGGTSLIVSSLAVGLAMGAARRRSPESIPCNPSNVTVSSPCSSS